MGAQMSIHGELSSGKSWRFWVFAVVVNSAAAFSR